LDTTCISLNVRLKRLKDKKYFYTDKESVTGMMAVNDQTTSLSPPCG